MAGATDDCAAAASRDICSCLIPVGLAVGPDLSDHRVDADFRGDAFGDLRLVSRQHHRADASGSKRCYRLLEPGLTLSFV